MRQTTENLKVIVPNKIRDRSLFPKLYGIRLITFILTGENVKPPTNQRQASDLSWWDMGT